MKVTLETREVEMLIRMASAPDANSADRGVPEPGCAGSEDDEMLLWSAAVSLLSVTPSSLPPYRTIYATEIGKNGQPI